MKEQDSLEEKHKQMDRFEILNTLGLRIHNNYDILLLPNSSGSNMGSIFSNGLFVFTFIHNL